jgi:hypothetical protein
MSTISFARRVVRRATRAFIPQRPHSQSDESALLDGLVARPGVPHTFVEFGFSADELNCASLVRRFSGLLIDGDPENVRRARRRFPSTVEVIEHFLDLDSLGFLLDRHPPGTLGVLSVDVDGNDYWFLERLLPIRPAIVAVEYNASLGLQPLTVPYDPTFRRHDKHPSGWYHGASLTALTTLCARHGYELTAVSEAGTNAFFVPAGAGDALEPAGAYRENAFRNAWSSTTAAEQWQAIADLPYEQIRA